MTFNALSTTFMKFGISELSFKIKSDALQSLKLLTSKLSKTKKSLPLSFKSELKCNLL